MKTPNRPPEGAVNFLYCGRGFEPFKPILKKSDRLYFVYHSVIGPENAVL